MRSRNISILLTEATSYRLWESAGRRLVEAELTADQIQQLFASIAQGAADSGNNRTLVGKGKDAASAVNAAWEDLKTKVQNSGPIKNVDSMYDSAAEKLKQATGGDQGVMKYVQKYRDFATAHPIAQSLIYSALIAAAGISGVGAGGAAALGLFKMVDKLLQGQKFSSAAYQGAKTGATAYAAGQIGKAIRGNPEAGGASGSSSQGPTAGVTDGASQRGNSGWNSMKPNVNPDGSPMTLDQVNAAKASLRAGNATDMSGIQPRGGFGAQEKINQMMQAKADAAQQAAGDAALGGGNADVPGTPVTPDTASNGSYQQSAPIGANGNPMRQVPMDTVDAPIRPRLPPGASMSDFSNTAGAPDVTSTPADAGINRLTGRPNVAAPAWDQMTPDQQAATLAQQQQQAADAAQGTQNAKDYWANKNPLTRGLRGKSAESSRVSGPLLTENQIDRVFRNVSKLSRLHRIAMAEGSGWDAVKAGASKIGQGIAQSARTIGSNITNKVTADKLNTAWTKAGSPTDSNAVADIIRKAGVDDSILTQAMGAAGIEAAPAANSDTRTEPTMTSKWEDSINGLSDASPEEKKAAIAAVMSLRSKAK